MNNLRISTVEYFNNFLLVRTGSPNPRSCPRPSPPALPGQSPTHFFVTAGSYYSKPRDLKRSLRFAWLQSLTSQIKLALWKVCFSRPEGKIDWIHTLKCYPLCFSSLTEVQFWVFIDNCRAFCSRAISSILNESIDADWWNFWTPQRSRVLNIHSLRIGAWNLV